MTQKQCKGRRSPHQVAASAHLKVNTHANSFRTRKTKRPRAILKGALIAGDFVLERSSQPALSRILEGESMTTNNNHGDRNLAMELVRATEAAAIAAGPWVGAGEKNLPQICLKNAKNS